jgi:hypothetical protein
VLVVLVVLGAGVLFSVVAAGAGVDAGVLGVVGVALELLPRLSFL